MLIQEGLKHKKVLGIKRKVKAPDFHDTFGVVETLPAPFNLDAGIFPSFNQNEPNPYFGTPAQPEGCTGMSTSKVLTNLWKIPVNPYQPYVETVVAEFGANQTATVPVQMVYALNEPIVTGVQVLNETGLRKTPHWYEVTSLNGSLFMGMVSAMSRGGASISYAGDFYESYESPVNGIVPSGSGPTSGHDWVFCGLEMVNNTPYLIAEPWLGPNWGGNPEIGLKGGFCLFSQEEVDGFTGQAFTPNESPQASNSAPLTVESVLESLINFLKELLTAGSTGPVLTVWEEMEGELQTLKNEIMEEKVYLAAKNSLGKHMTLNEAIPDEVGCAEAVSAVLALASISDGRQGIAGTAALYEWLNSKFPKIAAPEPGAIICSPTGQGNGSVEGHVGIFGRFGTQFPGDFGIMSNDSATGLFLETWSWTRWQAYYRQAGALPLAIFRPVDIAST